MFQESLRCQKSNQSSNMMNMSQESLRCQTFSQIGWICFKKVNCCQTFSCCLSVPQQRPVSIWLSDFGRDYFSICPTRTKWPASDRKLSPSMVKMKKIWIFVCCPQSLFHITVWAHFGEELENRLICPQGAQVWRCCSILLNKWMSTLDCVQSG